MENLKWVTLTDEDKASKVAASIRKNYEHQELMRDMKETSQFNRHEAGITEVDQRIHLAFNAGTALGIEREGLLVDTGAHDNLCGSQWAWRSQAGPGDLLLGVSAVRFYSLWAEALSLLCLSHLRDRRT